MPGYCVAMVVSACLAQAAEFPAAAIDVPSNRDGGVAVFAGGCFWGMEAVFEHLKGVRDVTSGYTGGSALTAHYEIVSTGRTGHAESIRVAYDPSRISYGKLLQVFFGVAHDPTELNRQGPDEGTQYRSAVFYLSPEQKRAAESYIQQLAKEKVFRHPIVTQVVALNGFFEAEDEHQDFIARNPTNPYVVYNDLPKIDRLKRQFPDLFQQR